MENEEIDSASSCLIGKNVLEGQSEVSLASGGYKSNTDLQNEKNELGSNSSKENSEAPFDSASMPSETIKVYLRLKPFPSDVELTREQEDAYTVVDSTTLLTKFPRLDVNTRSLKNLKSSERVCRTFTFTTAFGPETSQRELFEEAIKLQLVDFLTGQSSTVMSYGTSNAGKSYTLYGEPSELGIIPLSIIFIFWNINTKLSTAWYKPISQSNVIGLSSTERVRELEIRDKLLSFTSLEKTESVDAYQTIRDRITREEEVKFTERRNEHFIYSVWVSFAEIYNDAIYDLLSTDCSKKKLPLKMVTDKQGRTFIKDLRMVYVNTDEEAYQVLLAGQFRSRIAATTLNPRSSRSHCIFTIKLLKYCANSMPEEVEMSALSFCDLAGSGRLKMTTNVGVRLKETQNINTSLLVLGRCLKSIWEGQTVRQKSDPIGPFRESKLTRLFQKALSGKERITLIVNVNPVPSLYAETQNVLNFSAIAKKIIVEPVKEGKPTMFTSRFSQLVSQSVKTVTDWDHATVEDSTHETNLEKLRESGYVLRDCYDDLLTEFNKLEKEHAALKTSMLDKEVEIREEMANTYTGLLNDLEASWRNRSKDVEEQQEHLLAWSVSQVENFYKEKLNRLNSRKRRRWDDGDAVDDREAEVREMAAENASLNAKIVVAKETIKELRSAKENAIAEKNKAVFELSLLKEEAMGIKKMLEAAENDIGRKNDGLHFTEELKKQLNTKEERIKNLKEFLNEAKEEYIRITSDAHQMHQDLKETNAALIENVERIEDLQEQLDQSNACLAERTKEVDDLTETVECLRKKLAESEQRNQSTEEELRKSESIRLNLVGAVDDLNKLHKIECTCVKNVEPVVSSVEDRIAVRDRLKNIDGRPMSSENIDSSNIMRQETCSIDTVGSLYERNQSSLKFSDSSAIDDSGIAVTFSSDNQTVEQINCTADLDINVQEKNSVSQQFTNLQFESNKVHNTLYDKEIPHGMKNSHQVNKENYATSNENNFELIANELRLLKANKLGEEVNLADIIVNLEARIEEYQAKIDMFQSKQNKEKLNFDCLKDNVCDLEKHLSEMNIKLETAAINCLDEQGMKIEKLEKEVAELNKWLDDNSQSTRIKAGDRLEEDIDIVRELKQKVEEFEKLLAKCPILLEDETNPTSFLSDELTTDFEETLNQFRKHSCTLNAEMQGSNWGKNKDKLSPEMNFESDEDVPEEIKALLAFEASETIDKLERLLKKHKNQETREQVPRESNDLYLSRNQNEQKYRSTNNLAKDSEYKVAKSLNDETSPTRVDLLAASTPTGLGAVAHSHSNLEPNEHEDPSLVSPSTSAAPLEKESLIAKKKLFVKSNEDVKPREEVHNMLGGREIVLIVFILIVHLFELI